MENPKPDRRRKKLATEEPEAPTLDLEGSDPAYDEQIRKRLKEAIASKKKKLKQFARESQIPYPSLRDYNGGLRKPGFDAIVNLLKYTGVSAEWLILGAGPMFPNVEKTLPLVDEELLSAVARAVAMADQMSSSYKGVDVRETGEEVDALRERKAKQQGLIAAEVYNRIASIPEPQRRYEAIENEARQLVRFYERIRKSGDA